MTENITQVAPALYAIAVPLPGNPLKTLNAYVIRGPRNLLVDTGFRQQACREALTAGLSALGIRMEETDIFLTHLHSDHTGLAPELAAPGTNIYIGEHDIGHMPGSHNSFSWLDSDRRFAAEGFPTDLLRKLVSANPAQSLAPLPYDGYIAVTDGQIFSYGPYHFRAIHTPGHTPGHMILWDEHSGTALLGDHVLFDITPNITRWADRTDSLGDYLTSLTALRSLPVTLPLPAHRGVEGNYVNRIDALLAHHDRRCAEVLNVLNAGGTMNAWCLAARMTWKIRAASWDDFPPPQKWFAVGEAMAHLDHLIVLGRVHRLIGEDGQVRYCPA